MHQSCLGRLKNSKEKVGEQMKRNRRNRGFSMIETLVAVALVAILSTVAVVGVSDYRRSLHQLEMDGIAKELFVAAQNHLTMAESQGYLGRSDFGIREDGEENIFYMVAGREYDPDDRTGVLNLMLPFGAIDEYIRTGGSYVIRYQSRPAQVLDVFYAEPADTRYGHSFSSDEYDALMGGYRGEDRKSARSSYGPERAVIGYYGGAPVSDLITGKPLEAPAIQVVNQETLYVRVSNPNGDIDHAALKLVVTGMTSGVSREIHLITVGAGGERIFATQPNVTVGGNTFTVVLDDITAAGGHFHDLFCGNAFGENLIPGEDIAVQAVAYNNFELTNVAYSAEKSVNSLFSGLTGGSVAKISNIRHLENLSAAVSGLGVALTGAEQTEDLSWPAFCSGIDGADPDSVRVYGINKIPSAKGAFMPVDAPAGLDYSGGGYSIAGITVDTDSPAGLFGTVSGGRISHLELLNFSMVGSHAGALAGVATGVDIYGVLACNVGNDAELKIIGTDSVGGLVGNMSGGSIEQCAAALYVHSTAGDAGGLVGSVSDAEISYSYSGGHTTDGEYLIFDVDGLPGRTNVRGAKNAGGLIGSAESTGISFCYSTCSVAGSAAAGGFVGETHGGEISSCYATGLVGEAAVMGSFAGAADGTDLDDGNLCLEIANHGMAAIGSGSGEIGIIDRDKAAYSDFVRNGSAAGAAYPYDRYVAGEFAGRYYFPTVAQLAELENALPFIASHYGDWAVTETKVVNEKEDLHRLSMLAAPDRVRVNYDPNGGDWEDTDGITEQGRQYWAELDYGAPAILPETPDAPDDMILMGWTADAAIAEIHDFSSNHLGITLNALRTEYLWNFDEPVKGNMTLYAVWSESVTVTFTLTSSLTTGRDVQRWAQENDEHYYLAKGGKGISARIAKGDTVVCPTDPSDYTKKQYHSFFRWLDENDDYRKKVFESEEEIPDDLWDSVFDFNTPVLADKTLYPSWLYGDVPPDSGEPQEVKVILKKINGVFDVLSGGRFTIENERGKEIEKKLSADENGIIYVGWLEEGYYYIYEKSAPDGYRELQEPYTLVVTAEGTIIIEPEK